MAAKKFLRIVAGIITEITGVVVSTGAPNDGDIPVLDAAGALDITLIPRVPAQTYAPAAAATATLDLALSNEHRITMPAGNIIIALSNETLGRRFLVSITQDGVGSRTVTWFSTIRWAGGTPPVLTTTASKRDVFGFVRTGANTYDGFFVGANV